MRNISQQIVNNDSPDFSNNHHAIVAPNITPNVTRPRLHKMISAAEMEINISTNKTNRCSAAL